MSATWKNISVAICLYGTTVHLSGQGVLPQQSTPPPAQPENAATPAPGTKLESDTMLEAADRVFDTDSDTIDFEEGDFNWKGRSFNLGDSRLIRARFERYLASPLPFEDVAAYESLLEGIERRLQVNNLELDSEVLEELWNLLFEAAEYQIDGGNSLIVANASAATAKMAETLASAQPQWTATLSALARHVDQRDTASDKP
ncbi:MAG: hypothetical protein AAF212_01650, partial [Verrucomicrobiota bacterium]